MGRELIIHRVDFMNNGDVIIRECKDTYVCGRTEFTGDIASLFYNRKTEFLVVDSVQAMLNEVTNSYPKTVHVKTEDDGWDEKEFDMTYDVISLETVLDICEEGIEKDNAELKRESDMLEDARAARRNTRTVEDFNDFSNLIDEITDWIDRYCEDAAIFKKHLLAVEEDIASSSSDDIKESYTLLVLSE